MLDWNKILQKLEPYHGIFAGFWAVGRVIIDENVAKQRACIIFNHRGNPLTFAFAPSYLAKLTEKEVLFVICHEIQHVILEHGKRGRGLDKHLANVAMDIVINEENLSEYGFDRKELPFLSKDLCFLDNIQSQLPKDVKMLPGQNFEYYYNILYKETPKISFNLCDDHSGMNDDHGLSDDEYNRLLKDAVSRLTDEEKKDLLERLKKQREENKDKDKEKDKGKKAGSIPLGIEQYLEISRVQRKDKWEKIIKKKTKKLLVETYDLKEQWITKNRRIAHMESSYLLPSENWVHDIMPEKKKITLSFYLDTSGSCGGLEERFFRAALSIDPKFFNIELFCFDTEVYPTTLESRKVYGGGGTCFQCIDRHVRLYPKKDVHVFVITDGYGTNVVPENPQNWTFFLTEGGSRECIDPKCNIYNLEDFE